MDSRCFLGSIPDEGTISYVSCDFDETCKRWCSGVRIEIDVRPSVAPLLHYFVVYICLVVLKIAIHIRHALRTTTSREGPKSQVRLQKVIDVSAVVTATVAATVATSPHNTPLHPTSPHPYPCPCPYPYPCLLYTSDAADE